MRGSLAAGALLSALLAIAACNSVEPPVYVVESQPPTRKDVIAAVLAGYLVPLTVHPSCMGVGTETTDATIGDYLSGFLSELSSADGGNWLETRVETVRSESGENLWRAELLVRHSAGEDEWGWGVRFDVRATDGSVDPRSFRCVGSG